MTSNYLKNLMFGNAFSEPDLKHRYMARHALDINLVKKMTLVTFFIIFFTKWIKTIGILAYNDLLKSETTVFYIYPLAFAFIAMSFILLFKAIDKYSDYFRCTDFLFFFGLAITYVVHILLSMYFSVGTSSYYYYWLGVESQMHVTIILCVFRRFEVRMFAFVCLTVIQIASHIRCYEDLMSQVSIFGLTAGLGLVICTSELQQRRNFWHYYGQQRNFMNILNILPNSVIVLDNTKAVTFSNDYSQLIFAGQTQEVNPSLRKQVYNEISAKLKKLTLRTSFGRIKFGNGKEQEMSSSVYRRASLVQGPQIQPETRKKLLQIEEEMHGTSLDKIIEKLLDSESFIREHSLHINVQNQEHYFLTFEGSHDLRTFEINITFTSTQMTGSLLLIIRETSLLNQINFYKTQEKTRSLALASISHELRNPLNGSLALLECANVDGSLPPEIVQAYIQPAINTLKMMQSLVNDILDYSQIEENKFKLVFQEIDLRQVIYDTLSVVSMQASIKGTELKVDISDDVPTSFTSDAKRLCQILLNLLSNALKFTNDGQVLITANIVNDNTSLVEIAVEDTGIGMNEKNLQKLFKSNYTKIDLGENAHLNTNGCGLGLNIANKLAMALGRGNLDHMKASSQEGKGSTFSFIIESKGCTSPVSPLLQLNRRPSVSKSIRSAGVMKITTHSPFSMLDDDAITTDYVSHLDEHISREERQVFTTQTHSQFKKSSMSTSPRATRISFKLVTMDVLIVDDDSYNIYALGMVLKSFGIKSSGAYNGLQAIELLDHEIANRKIAEDDIHSPDRRKIIFLDGNMPKMNGVETAKHIKENIMEKGLLQVTMIGVTGDSEGHMHQKMLSAGVDEVLVKPLTRDVIKRVLDKYGVLT